MACRNFGGVDEQEIFARFDRRRSRRRPRALSAPEAQQLCDAYGIPTPKQGFAKTAAEAVKLAARLRYPVVLKIVSHDILHKTEAGGVIVGLE